MAKWNAQTLPKNDNVNPYAYSVDLKERLFMQKGSMIAYYGQVRFEPLGMTSARALVARAFSSPLYSHDWVIAEGNGMLVLADRGMDINSYDLDEGNLTIRASNLLAFDTTLELKESIVPGFLTLLGTGKFLASSNGPVMFVEPPFRVDPDALVGWADCPSPSHHHDANWMEGFLGGAQGMMGRVSGEERQFDFTGAGTVLLQSTEMGVVDPHVVSRLKGEAGMLNLDSLHDLQYHVQGLIHAQEQQY